MDSPPRVLSGRYELVHLVARGGMAEVYRAHDRLLDRPVALKVLFPELSVDRTFVERFRREAQAAANLSHPNIVPVFDWGEDSGTYFIVMEFIDGRPLSSILRTAGPLHPDRAAEIAADVALALDYAHRHGVVHRDIKPGNVLITDEGQVKVTDFGIARAVNTDESLTQTGAVMGTATYFSPEQAEGLGVDSRSDIYSLGVVLYEMVAGRPPFVGDSPVSVASKHVREQAPAPRQFNPSIPLDLEAIILKCMAKSPEYRYATSVDLRVDLLRFREGREVGATKVPPQTNTTQVLQGGGTGTGQTQALPQMQTQPPEEEEDKSRTGLYAGVLGVLLIALAVVVLFLGNTLGWWHLGSTSSSFSLQNLTNEKLSVAEAKLNSLGLDYVVKSVSSTAADKDTVLSTDPAAGAQVKKGDKITLDVGSGVSSNEVQVPNVTGFQIRDALALLKTDGLGVPVQTSATCGEPNGQVCSQNPAPLTMVTKGTSITLFVSTVTPTSTTSSTVAQSHVVPLVTDDTTTAACAAIATQGLVCGPSSGYIFQYSSTVSQNLVITTQPPTGETLQANQTVNLVVSKGPAPITVPGVVGDDEQTAESQITSAGLSPSVILNMKDHNPADCGIVTKQSPAQGTPVKSGATVTITVGDGPSCGTTSTVPPTT
jgi:eukaryotic-like serine/threonine-protein kinase